jgi:FtsZ-binding cell division protein ZapB
MEEDAESVRQAGRKNVLIQQILNLQQELQALEDRSQHLQQENNFYQEHIEELKKDIEIMQAEAQK